MARRLIDMGATPGPEPSSRSRRPGGRPGRPLRSDPPDLVTRLLCSACYLRPRFADLVVEHTVKARSRAIHPCQGVDLVALVRHAAAAKAMHDGRRRAIRTLWFGCLPAGLLLVALRAVGLATAGGVLTAGMLLLLLSPVAVWSAAYFCDRRMALRARALVQSDGGAARNPRDMAPALADRGAEARIRGLKDGNVVVFSGLKSGGNPFIGNGLPVNIWTIVLDVSRPARKSDGTTEKIDPISAGDLHQRLATYVREATFQDLEVRERLYVNGLRADKVPGLLTDGAPCSQIAEGIVSATVDEPTEYARTYLCFEKSAWGGEMGVTFAVRAQLLQNRTLFIEGLAFALLPLAREYYGVVSVIGDARAMLARVRRYTLRSLLRPSAGQRHEGSERDESPSEPEERSKGSAESLDDLLSEVVVDYGAELSIRDEVASRHSRPYFSLVDEEMYLQTLQRRILDGVFDFLESKHVDTSEFRSRQTAIINKSIIVGTVSGAGSIIGDHGTVHQTSTAGAGSAASSPSD